MSALALAVGALEPADIPELWVGVRCSRGIADGILNASISSLLCAFVIGADALAWKRTRGSADKALTVLGASTTSTVSSVLGASATSTTSSVLCVSTTSTTSSA